MPVDPPTVNDSPRSLRIPGAWGRGAVGAAVFLAVLEIVTRADLVSRAYLPPASSIIAETFSLFWSGEFWSALWITMQGALLGLALAVAIAVPLGLVLGLWRWMYEAVIVVVELFRPLPSVALIPLVILLWGKGVDAKAYLVLYACLWPILFNAIYGMRSIDPITTDTARAFGLSTFATMRRVYLRAAAPFVFTGVRVASAVAIILAVSFEIIAGGSGGLGIEMVSASAVGNTKLSYAYTLTTGVVGLCLHFVFDICERRWFAWQKQTAS